MTAFDKKINQIATRHRWNIEKQARAAVPCYIIAAPTYEDAGKIVAVLNRCKGLHHETLTPIHYESWAVKVYDAGQLDAWRERERQKSALVDAFYMALKANGGDQNAAKAAQREKAVQCERPGKAGKKKKAGAAARCASVVPAFSAAVVAPVQGCFCRLPEGSDSSLNGISLQW